MFHILIWWDWSFVCGG